MTRVPLSLAIWLALAGCGDAPTTEPNPQTEPDTADAGSSGSAPEDTAHPPDTRAPRDPGARATGPPLRLGRASGAAEDDRAHEDGAEPARFVITLAEAQADATLVGVQIGGSATLGDDYTLTAGGRDVEAAVEVPAGETTVELLVTPVVSATVEPTETVTVTVVASSTVEPSSIGDSATASLVEHGPSMGTTYTVAVDGDDSATGDADHPFATLAHGVSVLTAGDTLLLRDGVHTNRNYVAEHGATGNTGIRHGVLARLDASGEPGNWIRIAAEPDGNGVRPILRFDGSGGLQIGSGVSHVVIEGLEIEGHNAEITHEWAMAHRWTKENFYTGRGLFTWGPAHHIVVRDNVVHHTPGSGIRFNASDYILVEDNVVSNTTWWSSSAESGVVIATAVSIDTEDVVKILYSGNVVYNNWNLLEFCEASFEGSTEDAYGNCDRYSGGIIDGQGLYVTRNNDTYAHGRMRFENNLAFNNGFGGVVYHKTDRGELANNLVFMNGAYPGISNYSGLTLNTAEDVVIVNNLVWPRDSDDYGVKKNGPTDAVVTHSNYVVGRAQLLDETVDTVVAYEDAPALSTLFANASDLALLRPDPDGSAGGLAPADIDALVRDLALDFRLRSTATPLVDQGTPSGAPGADRLGVVRPQGAGIDIGPHEHAPE